MRASSRFSRPRNRATRLSRWAPETSPRPVTRSWSSSGADDNMARRSYEGTGVLPGLEERPVRKDPAKDTARTRRFFSPRLIITFVTAIVVMGVVLFAFHLTEQFLITD